MDTNYYRDIYKRRGNWWGATDKDQYLNISKKYFEDYLLSSPTADTIILNNSSFKAGVQDNKQDDSLLSKIFLISLDENVEEGNIIDWNSDKWIVIRKEKKSFEAYHKVIALRCNYTLKWVNIFGILEEQPAYIFGSGNTKIEESFKTWNGIYSPKIENLLMVITPFIHIPLEQRFIIRDNAWKLQKKDLISTNGILYLTLGEDRIDNFNDDIENQVANNNNLNSSYIDLGITSLTLGTNESFTLSPILYQNGNIINNVSFSYSAENNKIIIANSTITAGNSTGNSSIVVSYETLMTNCPITIISSVVNPKIIQIFGDETIKHGRTRTYTVFYNDGNTVSEINSIFELVDSQSLVSSVSFDNTSYTISANNEGRVGSIILKATTDYGIFEKNISIISIW